jgi:hypothetical protein
MTQCTSPSAFVTFQLADQLHRGSVFPMRYLILVLAVALAPSAAFAQQTSAEDTAVRKAIADHYFKAQETGSGDPLKGMFVDEGG